MNKRQRKKLHKRLLEDICYEVSVSSYWRGELKQVAFHAAITIDRNNSTYLPKYLHQEIKLHSLNFCLEKQPYRQIDILGHYPDSYVIFCISPSEFPSVRQISMNNPDLM
ncbi:hypothetical protein ACFVS2_33965 [Brevibacillus sp. NPDC058079]|uniref:hypothetical protein n=1 Tax=Brevibacillus sp. NPDC058079 TaxID=3346330 RepID=UPI0036E43CE9